MLGKPIDIVMMNGRVLLKLVDAKEKYGSLYIPDTGKDVPQEAHVVAVCPKWEDNGIWKEPLVEVGDKVLFGKYDGAEIELYGQKYIAIRESSLIAIVEAAAQSEPPVPAPSSQSE